MSTPQHGVPASEELHADAFLTSNIEPDPKARPSYHRVGRLLLALLVTYHLVALLQHLFPRNGLALRFSRTLNRYTGMEAYIKRSTHTQGWKMFAPNPIRRNEFTRVYLEDEGGEIWDLKHDIYGRRPFPYLFYDRMGKLNRRLMGKHRRWQIVYAAWVCREAERDALLHATPAPKRVHLVKLWNRIPRPHQAWRSGGYDPMRLRIHRVLTGVYDCTQIPDGRLTNHQRVRAGLPTVDDQAFVVTPSRTWWERQEATARIQREQDSEQTSDTEAGEGL